MAKTGVDVVSLDWTVDMAEGRERVANGRKAAGLAGRGGVQGNLDPDRIAIQTPLVIGQIDRSFDFALRGDTNLFEKFSYRHVERFFVHSINLLKY